MEKWCKKRTVLTSTAMKAFCTLDQHILASGQLTVNDFCYSKLYNHFDYFSVSYESSSFKMFSSFSSVVTPDI